MLPFSAACVNPPSSLNCSLNTNYAPGGGRVIEMSLGRREKIPARSRRSLGRESNAHEVNRKKYLLK